MTTATWVATGGDIWDTASSWNPAVVPTATTDVLINTAGRLFAEGAADVAQSVTIDNAAGQLNVSNGGTLSIATVLDIQAGTFVLTGHVLNAGTVINAGTFTLSTAGTVVGGTIVSAGGTFTTGGGTLSGVTYDGTLNVTGNLFTTNGITVTGSNGTGAGTINLTTQNAQLWFETTGTLDNVVLNIGNTTSSELSLIVANPLNGGSPVLTLGTNAKVVSAGYGTLDIAQFQGSIVNNGSIIAAVPGALVVAGTFTNNAFMDATGGGTLDLELSGTTPNFVGTAITGGTYEADANSVFKVLQAGTIDTDDAIITLSGTSSTLGTYNTVGGAVTGLDASLATIGQTGVLTLANGRNFAAARNITDAGLLNLGTVAFSTGTLTVAATGTVAGAGTVTAAIGNAGLIHATGSLLKLAGSVTGTGTLAIDPGSALELAGASNETVLFNPGTLSHGTLVGGTLKIDTAASYTGTVTGFAPADTIDLGNIIVSSASIAGDTLIANIAGGGTQAVALTGTFTTDRLKVVGDGGTGTDLVLYRFAQASSATPNPVNFGNVHVASVPTQALSITNTASADGFSENLDATLVGTLTGAALVSGAFTGLAPQTTDSTHLIVGLATTHDGVQTGTDFVALATDGTNVDGNGQLALTTQTIAVSGTVFNYATALPGSAAFGDFHTAATANRTLAITNNATADGFSESLTGTVIGTAGSLAASGGFTRLAAGSTDNTNIALTLSTAHDGTHAASVALGFVSDGTNIDNLGTTVLPSQTIAATWTIFNFATAVAPGLINLGNVHVSGVLNQALTITNAATADGFSEILDASIGNATTGITASGAFTNLAAGTSNTAAIVVGVDTGSAGARSGTATLTLISDGTGIDTLGTTSLGTQSVTVTGNVFRLASASTVAAVSFGNHHVNDVLNQTLSLTNTAAADNFSENLDASLGTAPSGLTASGSMTGLAPGATNNTGLTVGLVTSSVGVKSGSIALALTSDGAGIDNLGTTALAGQSIAVSGTIYRLAAAGSIAAISFGNRHTGDTVSQAVSLTNTAASDGFSENLDAAFTAANTGFTTGGTVAGLAAGTTSNGQLAVGLVTTSDGAKSGNVTLGLTSDGTGIDGLGTTSLGSVLIAATGTVYNFATASVTTPGTLNFGNAHVGSTLSDAIAIANIAPNDGFSENLNASIGLATGAAIATGPVIAIAPGGTDNTSEKLGLNTANAGVVSGTAVLSLSSNGSGIDGLGTTILQPETFTAGGTLFNYATASIVTTPVNFGIVHVGAVATETISVSNLALSDGFSENLDALLSGATAGITAGGAVAGLAPGATAAGALIVGLNTGASAVESGMATLAVASDGNGVDGLGITTLTGQTITVTGTVNNYATAAFQEISGGGTFTQAGTQYTLNLGTLLVGGTAAVIDLGVANTAIGPADVLSGSFAVVGSSAFINSGFTAFSNVGAGQADVAPAVTLAGSQIGVFTETVTLTPTGSNGSGYSGTLAPEILTITGTVLSTSQWKNDEAGTWGVAGNWTGGMVPGPSTDAVINFADDPLVLHQSGNDTVKSLTNQAGDFVMAGGSLTTSALTNEAAMSWTGGSLILNPGTAAAATLANAAGATLTIAADGQTLAAAGAATFSNAGTLAVAGGAGTATLAVPLSNSGLISVTQGTLAIDGGGSSAGAGLSTGIAGMLSFQGGDFAVTSGQYAVDNTTIAGGTLDASAASSVFFVDSLRLAGAGTLLLGAQNATAQSGFVQGPGTWAGSTGTPFLSGSGTLTVFGGGTLIDGVESGSGLTRLVGTNLLGGGIAIDGGRTVENDGWMNWSSGAIALGTGDATAATQTGTLANAAGATFYVTADARIGNAAGGSMLDNAGVIAVFAGAGETDIDAALANPGYIQAQTGTLSLNGGGSSDGAHLFIGSNAVMQFGTLGSGAPGGTFSITSGQYTAGLTAITGGTLDVSAASAAVFVTELDLTAGTAQFGAQGNAAVQGVLAQTGGVLNGSQPLPVYGGAALTGGVQTGAAITRLFGVSVVGGSFALDGGRTLENHGWLNWSSGNILLGGGAASVTQSGTLSNAAGATFYVTADGRIATGGSASSGLVSNAGVIAVFAGAGETDIDAALDSTGGLQVQSGTLGLNGGGTIAAGNVYVAPGAVLQFGTAASTGLGGSFSFTGGAYVAADTVVQAGTVDLSAVSGISFGTSLALNGGVLLLGGNFPAAANFSQAGGTVSGSAYFYVSGPATLGNGLETGGGRTVLQGGGTLGGTMAFDGGRSVENQGALLWTGGTLTLGGGDVGTSTHAATVFNDAGAVLTIEGSGTIAAPGAGAVYNSGTVVGLGQTSVGAAFGNSGTVVASVGTLAFAGPVSGGGTFEIGGTARIDFATAVTGGGTMSFLYPGGTLEDDVAGTFGAAIVGFAAGDTIDAAAVGFTTGTTTVGFSNGTLTVASASQSAMFSLTGSYAANGFQIAADGHGGTAVTLT